MNDDRFMVAEAVFNGLIGVEHLTMEEVDEFCLLVGLEVMEHLMDKAYDRGCAVFSGMDGGDTVH